MTFKTLDMIIEMPYEIVNKKKSYHLNIYIT